MKNFLSASAMVSLLVFAWQITGANKNSKLLQPTPQELKKQTIILDTFYAVRTLFQPGRKAIVNDTVVLIMHEIKENPTLVRAGIKYLLEPIPFNALDTANPIKVRYDTVVWIHKPNKPL